MADLQAIKEQLDGLSLLEASQLVKLLEEAWGVSAAAPVAVAAAGGAAAIYAAGGVAGGVNSRALWGLLQDACSFSV